MLGLARASCLRAPAVLLVATIGLHVPRDALPVLRSAEVSCDRVPGLHDHLLVFEFVSYRMSIGRDPDTVLTLTQFRFRTTPNGVATTPTRAGALILTRFRFDLDAFSFPF